MNMNNATEDKDGIVAAGTTASASATIEDMATSITSAAGNIIIPGSDILRLIQAYLTESGLLRSSAAIREESGGVGWVASPLSVGQWIDALLAGQYAPLLHALALMDRRRDNNRRHSSSTATSSSSRRPTLDDLSTGVHELVILQLAAAGDWDLAYSTYRLVQNSLFQDEVPIWMLEDQLPNADGVKKRKSTQRTEIPVTSSMTRGRILEQKLHALASARQLDPQAAVPDDYYALGRLGLVTSVEDMESRASKGTKPKTTSSIATAQTARAALASIVPSVVVEQPRQRLLTLLQQAIKWQIYTGQMPCVERLFDHDDDGQAAESDEDAGDKRSKKRKRPRKEFDLLLGNVEVAVRTVGQDDDEDDEDFQSRKRRGSKHDVLSKHAEPWSTLKFGKRARVQAAIFLQDGSSLVTGTTDGLIEIWDGSDGKYRTYRALPYQDKEEFLAHSLDSNNSETHGPSSASSSSSALAVTALAMSNDGALLASAAASGHVYLWNFATGRLLRKIAAHSSSHQSNGIASLQFSPAATHILTAGQDGIGREFGLRTARLLKEFRGHEAYLTSASYHWINDGRSASSAMDILLVLTSSGDGTVRIWDGSTADCLRVMRPLSLSGGNSLTPRSIVMDIGSLAADTASTSPAIVTILPLHTPSHTMIVVPRTAQAFLVRIQDGTVLQTFQRNNSSSVTVTASNEKKNPDLVRKRHSTGDEAIGPVFVAATVSPSNAWFYTVDEVGVLSIFGVTPSKTSSSSLKTSSSTRSSNVTFPLRTVDDFVTQSTRPIRRSSDGDPPPSDRCATSSSIIDTCLITTLIHHPHQAMVAACSNDPNQEKGILVLWK